MTTTARVAFGLYRPYENADMVTSVKYSRSASAEEETLVPLFPQFSILLASRATKLLLKEKCVRRKTKFYCILNSASSVEARLA